MNNKLRSRLAWGLVMASFTCIGSGWQGTILPAFGQSQVDIHRFNPDFVTEDGCPVQVSSARTELEMDGFGVPMAARHYIDYSNRGDQPLTAVKFKIGYVGPDGNLASQMYAPDAQTLSPGAAATQKWRGDRVPSKIAKIKMRVFMVKFSDGTTWHSAKVAQQAAADSGFAPMTSDPSLGPDNLADASNRAPGTPVEFKEYGQSNYKAFPDRTQTGTVPLKSAPAVTNGASFAPNAFQQPGPFGASGGNQQMTAPSFATAPGQVGGSNAAPAAINPVSTSSAPSDFPASAPFAGSAPALLPPIGVDRGAPNPVVAPTVPSQPAAIPTAAPIVSTPAPVATPAASAPLAPAPVDPMSALDSLLGTQGQPRVAPSTVPATTGGSAPSAPAAPLTPDAVAPATPVEPAPAAAAPVSEPPAAAAPATPDKALPADDFASPAN